MTLTLCTVFDPWFGLLAQPHFVLETGCQLLSLHLAINTAKKLFNESTNQNKKKGPQQWRGQHRADPYQLYLRRRSSAAASNGCTTRQPRH